MEISSKPTQPVSHHHGSQPEIESGDFQHFATVLARRTSMAYSQNSTRVSSNKAT
jgi:hypothetical protein